jgi:hypothetical protein
MWLATLAYAAVPPDVRKASGLPSRNYINHPEGHSLSAHRAAEPREPGVSLLWPR